jgi:signal transduction histidine kinase
MGVVDLAALYHQGLKAMLDSASTAAKCRACVQSLESFFVESLAPFEMTHRGYRDAHAALRHLNETMENEAKRIARALHDESGQLLTVVHIALEDLARDLPPSHEARLNKIRAGLDQIEEQLRRVSHELRPPILDDMGLFPAVQFLAEGVAKRAKLNIKVEGFTNARLAPPVETAAYRIVQESLTNVAKHARAKHVVVRVQAEPKTGVQCSVQDDGIGFDLSAVSGVGAQRGLGLLGMRERVKALGGSLEINSSEGKGTELLIQIPLGS